MPLILKYFNSFWDLTVEMSPYLLIGFLFAGVLKVYVPTSYTKRLLGKEGVKSSFMGALFGVPLPLCSCGVIPAGIGLHKSGASKAATQSFLISTPQTGVDSILATWSLLGLPFAIIRPLVSFFTGFLGGVFTTFTDKKKDEKIEGFEFKQIEKGNKFLLMLRYAFFDFFADISKWLLIGLALAALISVLVPASFFETYLSNPLVSIFVVLLFSIPLYICATGSIPLAAVLLMKGISPGAALVLLMAGPATNAATITVVGKSMGKKFLSVYLATIILGAVFAGLFVDFFLPAKWFVVSAEDIGVSMLPAFISIPSAIIILTLIVITLYYKYFKKSSKNLKSSNMKIKVEGMTCQHCKANVEKAISNVNKVKKVEVNLSTGDVSIEGEGVSLEEVKSAVDEVGYSVKN